MMQGHQWCFTDEDRARLQPLLDTMRAKADFAVPRIVQMAESKEGCICILQGYCEELAEQCREAILEQVDRGEWSARGINRREDISITITVNAAGAVLRDEKMVAISIMPTSVLA